MGRESLKEDEPLEEPVVISGTLMLSTTVTIEPFTGGGGGGAKKTPQTLKAGKTFGSHHGGKYC